MLESVAFQSGIFLILATTIFSVLMWILAAFQGIRVERVGLMYAVGVDIYKKTVNQVEIVLGWIPLGSFVKMSGMIDEDLDEVEESEKKAPQAHDFRGKSFGVKLLIIMSSPLLLLVLGLLILSGNSNLPLVELLGLYAQISAFLLPLEAGNDIWNQLYTQPIFLFGFLFFIMGIGNILTNVSSLMSGSYKELGCIATLFSFSSIIFMLTLLRLVWLNFALINILYFFVGAMLTSIFAFLLCVLLAKILPRP